MTLHETKLDNLPYYQDDKGLRQGEAKSWYDNGQPRVHCFYKDDKYHGEWKWWHNNGDPGGHYFFQSSNDITDQVEALVVDILNITNEERLMIKIKFGIECLS